MDPRVVPLAGILRLNTRLLRNCLAAMTDGQAGVRPTTSINSAAFVAAHIADSRYFALRVLGAAAPSPLAPYLDAARSIDEVVELPPLAAVQSAWTAAAHALRDRLEVLPGADLDAPFTGRLPIDDRTVLGALAFLVQHESYHLGQLALLRKFAGLPAMSYA